MRVFVMNRTVSGCERSSMSTPSEELTLADEILERIDLLDAAHAERKKELRAELEQAIHSLALQHPESPVRRRIAWQLYWLHPAIPVRWIAEAFSISPHGIAVAAFVGPAEDLQCDACPRQITLKTRTQYQELTTTSKWVRRLLCEECADREHRERDEAWQQKYQAQAERLRALQAMPYKDYLNTPEWDETRRRHYKRSGYRCQVCNVGGVQLNVHHRTYERLGQEKIRDLICLCQDCHTLFHASRAF